jgi:hypothetical protein
MRRFLGAGSMIVVLAALFLALVAGSALAEQPALAPQQPTRDVVAPKPDPKVAAGDVFATCCMPCHQGETPAAKLDLSRDKFESALVDVVSTEIDTIKLVDTAKVKKSYVLMKLRADKRIRANPMPLRAAALDFAKIKAVELWIMKLVNIATIKTTAPSLGTAVPAPADATAPATETGRPDAGTPPGSDGAPKP